MSPRYSFQIPSIPSFTSFNCYLLITSDVKIPFETEVFVLSHLLPTNVTLRPRKTTLHNREALSNYQTCNKGTANESVETVVAHELLRLNKNLKPPHCLSMGLGDKKRPSRV